jgi:CD209 antigen
LGLFKNKFVTSLRAILWLSVKQDLPSVDISCGFFSFVPDGPDTPITSPESHFLPGANLSLSCHAASHPPVQYSWLFNGRPQSSTQELFIPNVTANNDRIYTCLVHNSATGLSRTTVKNILVLGVWIAEM